MARKKIVTEKIDTLKKAKKKNSDNVGSDVVLVAKKNPWLPPNYVPTGRENDPTILYQDNSKTREQRMMEWKLPIEGSPRFGDATKEMILQVIQVVVQVAVHKHSKTIKHLLKDVPKDKKVSEILTKSQLLDLKYKLEMMIRTIISIS